MYDTTYEEDGGQAGDLSVKDFKEIFQQLLLESGAGWGFLPQQQLPPRLAEVPDHSAYQKLVFLLLEQLIDSSVPGLLNTVSEEHL